MVKFVVSYRDDLFRKHMAFVKTFAEVKFYQDRFTEVSFEIL